MGVLTPAESAAVQLSTSNILTLDAVKAASTRAAYGVAVNLQIRTVMGFAVAAFVSSLFAWKKEKLLHLQEAEAAEALRRANLKQADGTKDKAEDEGEERGTVFEDSRNAAARTISQKSLKPFKLSPEKPSARQSQKSSRGNLDLDSRSEHTLVGSPATSPRNSTGTVSMFKSKAGSAFMEADGANGQKETAIEKPAGAHISSGSGWRSDWSLMAQPIESSSLFMPWDAERPTTSKGIDAMV
jgi:hypothetical protein